MLRHLLMLTYALMPLAVGDLLREMMCRPLFVIGLFGGFEERRIMLSNSHLHLVKPIAEIEKSGLAA
jgi:hypothetical protein